MRKTQPLLALGAALVLLTTGSVLLITGCDGSTAAAPADEHAGHRHERALPRFEGTLLDGTRASTDMLARKRGILFLFATGDDDVTRVADLVRAVRADAEHANVALIGINRDTDPSAARAFLSTYELDLPVFSDGNGAISRKLGVRGGQSAVIAVDGDGYIIFAFQGLDEATGLDRYELAVRDALHLTKPEEEVAPVYGLRPDAPDFTVETVTGEKLSRADLAGQVTVLMFFNPTCPHCHDALRFLGRLTGELGRPDLRVVPISVQNNRYLIEDMASEIGMKFTSYVDPDEKTLKTYAYKGGVPDTLILDRELRVVARHSGMSPRLEALITMEIRNALGAENPILLDAKGYSGEEFCRVCHDGQHETWSLTNHAYAFDTLIEHGEDRNAECVGCHTVGFEKDGGYDLEKRQGFLEGVQCENCHGRGGPHQTPETKALGGLQAACESCHTQEHSLRFVFGERLPLVSHAANSQFASLSLEERQALLERRDKRERTLFDSGEFVGSETCAGCHTSEHEIWAKSPHASAFETLAAKHADGNTDCQQCHTTGFEQTGGFPGGGDKMRGVGCESCHGPGGNHVAEGARRDGTILALTDKCDSCVIMQICGSCHDDANDPNFEFELVDKIDAIRHGFRDRPAAKVHSGTAE